MDKDAHDLDLPLAGDGANGSLKAQDIDRLRAGAPGALVFIVNAGLYSLVFHTESENSSYLIFSYNCSILHENKSSELGYE